MSHWLSNSFQYKDPTPKDLISGIAYKFQCGLYNESYYGQSNMHLDPRSGDQIDVLPLTVKKVKRVTNSAFYNNLLQLFTFF